MTGPMIGGDEELRERKSLAMSTRSAFEAFSESLMIAADARVPAPYISYLVFQLLLIAGYMASTSPPWTSIWAWPVPGIDGEALSHYPAHLILMQPVLGRVELILDIFLRILFHGATVYLVAAGFHNRKPSIGSAFRAAGRTYRRLLAVSLLSSATIYALIAAGRVLSGGATGPWRTALLLAGMGAGLIVQALLIYVTPAIVLSGKSLAEGLASGISLSLKTLTRSLVVVLVPFILTVPTTFLSLKTDIIALRLSPDFTIHIQVASRVMELVSTYLVTAAATVLYVSRRIRPERAGGGEVPRAAAERKGR